MSLYLSEDNYFLLSLGLGLGSNTKVELLGLYGLMFFSKKKDLVHVQVFGNSRVVIAWF